MPQQYRADPDGENPFNDYDDGIIDDDDTTNPPVSTVVAANQASHSLPVPAQVRSDVALQQHHALDQRQADDIKRSRFCVRFALCLCCVLIVTLVVLITVLVVDLNRQEDSQVAATTQTQTDRDFELNLPHNVTFDAMVDFLSDPFSSRTALQTEGTPQNLAAIWLLTEAPHDFVLPVAKDYEDAFELVQRYLLAVFYYALKGDSWNYHFQFLSSVSVCEWNEERIVEGPTVGAGKDVVGVQCNDRGEVSTIFIPDNNLDGSLPTEVGLLEAMEHFSVFNNQIVGTLPASMARWDDLVFLAVEANRLNGPIPDWINSFTFLEVAALGNNEFTGPLPMFNETLQLQQLSLHDNRLSGPIDVFEALTNLQVLLLQNNLLDGEFYPDLMAAVPLKVFDVSNNLVSGQLPSPFYTCHILDVHNNRLTGSLPPIEYEDYPIRFFSAYGNQLSGSITPNLGALQQLGHLDLSQNQFTGTIPNTLRLNTNLVYLYLGDNDLSIGNFPNLRPLEHLQELSLRNANLNDEFPSWLGRRLPSLQLLDLSHNQLTGTIPTNLAQISTLKFLLLGSNRLTGNVPDELAELRNLHMVTIDHNMDLVGQVGDLCSPDEAPLALELVLVDCALGCTCCETCCSVDNADTCGRSTVSPNLDGGYTRHEWVFSEDLTFVNSGTIGAVGDGDGA